MPYRRPGIQVTQEFTNLQPALASFSLPNCMVGDAYQVLTADQLGTYAGLNASYVYASLNAGNLVDIREFNPAELIDHQYPITARLINAKIEQNIETNTGAMATNLLVFSDATTNIFSGVVSGDQIEILQRDVNVVAALVNGTALVASPSLLTATGATDFTNASVGDIVKITGGTGVTIGNYTILSKADNQNITLGSPFYTGATSTADIAFTIDTPTGVLNAGTYTIKSVTDVNNLKLQAPLKEFEAAFSYRVLRPITEIPLTRGTHYVADANTLDILGTIQLVGKNVTSATLVADYRALRVDQQVLKSYTSVADLQATFGIDQIVPANPLAFGLFLDLKNTVSTVFGIGLGPEFYADEALAYQKALDTLKKSDMYILNPLTQNPAVHQICATHVDQMSAPTKKKERAVTINKKLSKVLTLQDTKTLSGEQTILNTQTTGIVISAASTLDASVSMFANIALGDDVHIVSGTGVTAGIFPVTAKSSDLSLTLGGGFSATANGSNVNYFIARKDGLGADGITFYDSLGAFITNGIVLGQFIVIESGSFIGRYAITAINSDQEVLVAQVPGVTTLQSSLSFRVEKDLTPLEMAVTHAAYASSFGNRRVVCSFPDTVKIPVGSVTKELPGFYLGCSIAGLTTGLPTQQGFTNLTVSGYLGFVNGSDLFDPDQIDIISGGGVMVFDQEVADAPLFIVHELTTDRSAIKFQEYQVTKNVDFIAKFMRNSLKDFAGVYNIVDGTYDELKSSSASILLFLKEETVQPRIGGVIKSGKLRTLKEGINIDTIAMRFTLSIPIPLNNIDVTIEV